jgi:predicted RNase H-like HicB family nuclease
MKPADKRKVPVLVSQPASFEQSKKLGSSKPLRRPAPRSGKKGSTLKTYTANYTKTPSGYMGQLVDWPEVITEGRTLEDCRESLQDALQEMIAAYRQLGKEIPVGGALIEQIPVEI